MILEGESFSICDPWMLQRLVDGNALLRIQGEKSVDEVFGIAADGRVSRLPNTLSHAVPTPNS